MLGSDSWVVQQLSDRCSDVAVACAEAASHLVEPLRWFDLVDRQLHRGLVCRVKNVVDGSRKREEGFAVKRSSICMRKLVHQDPPFGVALALDLLDLFDQIVVCSGLAAELLQSLQRPDRE